MKNILGNKNNLIVLALLGILVLVIALPTGTKKTKTNTTSSILQDEEVDEKEALEERLERVLKNTEGVGDVEVMITTKEESKSLEKMEDETEVEGVVVVAEGATDSVTKAKIQDIVLALFPVEAHKIEIVKMKSN